MKMLNLSTSYLLTPVPEVRCEEFRGSDSRCQSLSDKIIEGMGLCVNA
jgi:hypothetical protein